MPGQQQIPVTVQGGVWLKEYGGGLTRLDSTVTGGRGEEAGAARHKVSVSSRATQAPMESWNCKTGWTSQLQSVVEVSFCKALEVLTSSDVRVVLSRTTTGAQKISGWRFQYGSARSI